MHLMRGHGKFNRLCYAEQVRYSAVSVAELASDQSRPSRPRLSDSYLTIKGVIRPSYFLNNNFSLNYLWHPHILTSHPINLQYGPVATLERFVNVREVNPI